MELHNKQATVQLDIQSIRLCTGSKQYTNKNKCTTHQHSQWQSTQTCGCFCHHPCSAGSRMATSHAGPGRCRSMLSGGTYCPEGCTLGPALLALSGSAACAAVGMGQLWPVGHSCPCAAWLAGWLLGGLQPALLEDCCPVRACMAIAHHAVTRHTHNSSHFVGSLSFIKQASTHRPSSLWPGTLQCYDVACWATAAFCSMQQSAD